MAHFRIPSKGPSPDRELIIEVKTTFRGPLAEKIEAEAARKNMRPVDLLAKIVDLVFADNMVDAVLDEDA